LLVNMLSKLEKNGKNTSGGVSWERMQNMKN